MPRTIYCDTRCCVREPHSFTEIIRGRIERVNIPRYTAPPSSSAHAAVALCTGLRMSVDDAFFKLRILDEGAPLDGRLEADPARSV